MYYIWDQVTDERLDYEWAESAEEAARKFLQRRPEFQPEDIRAEAA
jgi:hypothetical protein